MSIFQESVLKILQKFRSKKLNLKLGILTTLLIPVAVLASDNIIEVTITAYTPSYSECDSDPHITSSNKKVKLGYVALSRDLEADMGLEFGDMVLIPFEFQDRMNKKWTKRIDLFLWSKDSALLFGKRKTKVFIIKREHWNFLQGGK